MTTQEVKRKLTAILSADVKGYSRLMGEDEEWTVRTLNAYREIMRGLIQQHRGRVVNAPGDNVLAEFASVVDAVQCSVEIQQVLRAKNAMLPENRRMEFRIGINLGDVIEEGEQIYGDGVNIAARLEGLADAGGICISESAYQQIENKLPLRYDYLGEHEVKNITKPVRVYRAQIESEAVTRRPLEAASKEKMAFPLPDKPSIAVLPFVNMSDDPKQEFFSDGMTEEIITALSKSPYLFVIARQSTFTYKGKPVKVKQVSEELGVRYVLEGSVRRSEEKVRITAQLIDAANDAHLWAEKYGGTLDDIFDIQEKVSHSIVDALKLKLTPEETRRLIERPIPSPLAYEFYLKARQEILKWTESGLENALRYLRNGLEIVGENAFLYAGMAYVYFQYVNLGLKEKEYGRKQAEDYVQKAFALDPDCPEASFMRANLIVWSQPQEGIRCFQRVLDKNPNHFDALFYFSCVLGTLGRKRDVVPLEERTIRIDPLNPLAYVHSGFNRMWDGEFALALERLEKLHRSFPGDVMTKWCYGLSLAYRDRKEEAGSVFDEVAREQPGTLFACMGLAFKYALEGKRSETLKMLEGRIQSLHFKDLSEKKSDVPFGTGVCDVKGMLTELKRQGVKAYFSIEYERGAVDELMVNVPKCVSYFDQVCEELAK